MADIRIEVNEPIVTLNEIDSEVTIDTPQTATVVSVETTNVNVPIEPITISIDEQKIISGAITTKTYETSRYDSSYTTSINYAAVSLLKDITVKEIIGSVSEKEIDLQIPNTDVEVFPVVSKEVEVSLPTSTILVDSNISSISIFGLGTSSVRTDIIGPFHEEVFFSDYVGKIFHKVIYDSITFSEAISFESASSTVNLNDSFSASDYIEMNVTKGIVDTLTLSDNLIFNVYPVYVDTLSLSEDISKTISKGIIDTITFSESFNPLVAKFTNLAEGATFSENLGITVSKVIFDSINLSDSITFLISPIYVDTITVSESGTLFIQNYVEPDYVAGDYVGITSTF